MALKYTRLALAPFPCIQYKDIIYEFSLGYCLGLNKSPALPIT